MSEVDWEEVREWATVALAFSGFLLAGAGFGLGLRSFFRDRNRDEFDRRLLEEQVEIQQRSYELAQSVHQWQQQQAVTPTSFEPGAPVEPAHLVEVEPEPPVEVEPVPPVEPAQGDDFIIRFGYRDSAHTWARIIATYSGPKEALDVELDAWGEQGGQRIEVGRIEGMDYSTADHLDPAGSVHFAFVFTFGGATAESLRYRVEWLDPNTGQRRIQQGPVPLN